ncbi:hypothetical protein B1L04_07620 [Microcystis aeruginosa KW]|uniref:Uncharacterized protein n=1 Tax=Microcystis aeruginosa KW TaxID=1960155 RepID=A0A1V4BWY9_MICAE|nr:hypothetical protein B1L04_07620 [Microcystis aeruginosa KW]
MSDFPPYQGGIKGGSALPLSRDIPPPIGTPLIKGYPPAYRHPPYQGGQGGSEAKSIFYLIITTYLLTRCYTKSAFNITTNSRSNFKNPVMDFSPYSPLPIKIEFHSCLGIKSDRVLNTSNK